MGQGQKTGSRGPLDGITIVDFSRMLSGPFSTMLMADLGAHVIRVEDLEGSDPTRHSAPLVNGESHLFLALNRNKESIALDLKSAAGRDIALGLVRQADIVVDNFRQEVATGLGLDRASLASVNPQLVHCSVSGFGQTGPWRDKAGYDLIIQSLTGALSVTGEKGRAPAKMGLPLVEEMTSVFAAIAMLAGIEKRARTGVGSYIDCSMFDVGISMLSYMANIFFATGSSPQAQGSSHPTIYPYNAFKTADGYIVVAPFTQAFWRKFCSVLERDDLPLEARFKTFAERLENREALAAVLEPVLMTRPSAEWLAALDIGDVPNGPVNTVSSALGMAQTVHRGMVSEFEHPVAGRLKTLGTPFHIELADGSAFVPRYAPPPVVGQHTRAILESMLAYDADGIASLQREGAIRIADEPGATLAQHRPAAPTPAGPATDEAPLAGIRVIDLTRMLAGPYATLVLADLGAEIIKVEEPRIGDPTRRNIPFVGEESTYFMAVNRGKKSITLDLKQIEERDALLQLVRDADVVIENYRPGVMERLGLSYADLRRVRPDIILCSISGYGQTGPLRDKISFDLVNQAMAGTMSVTGEADRPPVRVGLPAGDLSGGIFAAFGILAALAGRRRTGQGSHVDLALHDLLLALLGPVGQRYLITGEDTKPLGSGHHNVAPYQAYGASDGYLVIAAYTDATWQKFAQAIGHAELLMDERFADAQLRKQHEPALHSIIEPVLRGRTIDTWTGLFDAAGVPCARINSVGEALESAQSLARGIVFDYQHPTVGLTRTAGTPFFVDGKPWRSALPSPLLGEHNEEYLGSLLQRPALETGP